MKWNAFNLVEPAIDKTKELLFPIKLSYWMKLGFVSLLSAGTSFGKSMRFPSSGSSNFLTKKTTHLTENAISNLPKSISWFIGFLVFVIGIAYLILNFISSVFTFIFIDALVLKDYSIKKSWGKNKWRGASFFGFRILISIIALLILGLIFLPLIIQLFQQGLVNYFTENSFLTILFTLIPSIILAILWILIIGIFMVFVLNFSLVDMYKNKINITQSIKNTFRQIKNQKLESFIYLLANLVFSLAVVILSSIIILPVLIIFGIIGIIFFFGIFIFSKLAAIMILIPYVVFVIYTFSVVLLPLSVFMRYFSLLGYEKLFNTKIISNKELIKSKII